MPNIPPEWDNCSEANDIVKKLVQQYPDKLGHIDPDDVGCVLITNKDKPDSTSWHAKIVGATPPISLFCDKAYVIYAFQNDWENMTPAQRSIVLLDRLVRIPEEYTSIAAGKVLADDLRGWKAIIAKWGPDFVDNPNLPDVAEARQPF